ncbi:MAG TPA: TIGR03435 family protein [Bryobacteraceae bacterium]|jgi:uncharacterized protein (TIGR03435 family)
MNQTIAHRWNFGQGQLLITSGLTAVAILIGVGLANSPTALAQSQTPVLNPRPAFEVASIKRNQTGERPRMTASTGGLMRATNETLKYLIEWAYNVQDYQISGGPKWIDSAGYDIVAKPEHAYTPSQETIGYGRQLVQSLLEDRFKLIIQHTKKELPVYALVAGKDGPKLTEREKPANPTDARMSGGRGLMVGQQVMMWVVVQSLSSVVGRPVADETGLKRYYDFRLEWIPYEPAGAPGDGGNTLAPDRSGPSIFTALQKQLGLKLEERKGPVEVLVIDNVESPSEN